MIRRHAGAAEHVPVTLRGTDWQRLDCTFRTEPVATARCRCGSRFDEGKGIMRYSDLAFCLALLSAGLSTPAHGQAQSLPASTLLLKGGMSALTGIGEGVEFIEEDSEAIWSVGFGLMALPRGGR